MLQQVFMSELDAGRRTVLAHGWHPDVPNGRQDTDPPETQDLTHPVTNAAVSSQRIRIVFDEVLYGNALEEIACRNGTFSRVPLGATPDDIANCAVADDLLVEFCKGPMSVCLGPDNVPVGVLDEDENGSADNTQMIDGAVKIVCGAINVPLNREASFWQPAGNQLVPAGQIPQNSLGPALIVVPDNGLLPSASTCHIEFAPDVTDKEFNQPCVPTGGVEDTDNIGDCAAGDLAAFSFGTESISLDSSVPTNNSTNIALNRNPLSFILSARPDAASVATATVTVMEGAGTRTDFTVGLNAANPARVEVRMAANLIANTMYTISISGLSDSFGVAIAPMSFSFTTVP
ncbi:MAG: Ig-like domain-containing protein [Myxococcales bacterium]|nr:Ig-like domain-containing protein [Myxococcales bacterium]